MKLSELIELVRGLDDKAFLERFSCPFLVEEGTLAREQRAGGATAVGADTRRRELDELAARRAFPVRRRDGKPGDIVVGRAAQSDIHLDVQSVSTRHAVLKGPGDGRSRWCVVDTVSTNGTFVDGQKIATGHEVELADATVVRFGPDLRLAFYEPHEFLRVVREVAKNLTAEKAALPAAAVPAARSMPPKFRATEPRGSSKALEDLLAAEPSLVETDIIRRNPEALHKTSSGRFTALSATRPASDPTQKALDSARAEGNRTELAMPAQKGPPPAAADKPGSATRTIPRPPTSPSAVSPPSGPLRAVPVGGATDAPIVLLTCEPFAPLPLEPFRPIVIGRVPGNDFVLPNPQVSRRHCEVERVRDGIVVRDLGSANGTFVDEKRIDRATIPYGGRFQLGPYKLEVRPVDPTLLPSGPKLGDTLVSAPRASEGLRGSFEDMPLAEILSGVEFNQKTGVIDIHGEGSIAGFVSFRGGAPHQARCGDVEGEPAVLALLALKAGRFVLKSDESAVGSREIRASFTKLLLDYNRLHDEGSKGPKKG